MKKNLVQVAVMLMTRVLSRGAQVIAFVLLARYLSPAGFGIFSVITSAIFLIGQIGNLGLRQAAAYMVGQKRMSDGEAMATLLTLWPLLSLLCAAGVVAFNKDQLAGMHWSAILAAMGAVAAVMLVSLLQGVLLGRGQIKDFGLSDAVPRLLLVVMMVAAAVAGWISLTSSLWIFSLSFIIAVPYVVLLAARDASKLRLKLGELWPMVRYGFIFAISMFLITLNMRIGLFVIEDKIGAASAGHFFAGQRMNELFLEFATVVGLVIFSKAARGESANKSVAEAANVSAWIFWFFLAIALPVALFAKLIIPVLLGAAYIQAAPIVATLVIGLAPAAVVKIMNGVTSGSGKPYTSAAIVGLGVIINVVITLILSGAFGIQSAAWGLVASQIFCMLAYMYICRIKFGVPFKAFLVPNKGSPNEKTSTGSVTHLSTEMIKKELYIALGSKDFFGAERRYLKIINYIHSNRKDIRIGLIVNSRLFQKSRSVPAATDVFDELDRRGCLHVFPDSPSGVLQTKRLFSILPIIAGKRPLHLLLKARLLIYFRRIFGGFAIIEVTSGDIARSMASRMSESVLTNSTRLVCVSDSVENALRETLVSCRKKIPDENISVWPLPYAEEKLVNMDAKEKLVVFASRFIDRKNALLFAQAVANVAPQRPAWKFAILGQGPHEDAIRRLLEVQIAAGQVQVGYVTDVGKLLAKSKIYVSLITPDNYPSQSVLEAMAYGNALLLGNTGSSRLFLDDVEPNGRLCELSVGSVGQALLELTTSELRLNAMGQSSSTVLSSRFSSKMFVDALLDKHGL